MKVRGYNKAGRIGVETSGEVEHRAGVAQRGSGTVTCVRRRKPLMLKQEVEVELQKERLDIEKKRFKGGCRMEFRLITAKW